MTSIATNIVSSRAFRSVTFVLILLAIWQGAGALSIWPDYLVPTPSTVWEALYAGFSDNTFVAASLISLKRILIGFGLSMVAGTILGFMIGRFKLLDDTVGTVVLGLQTLPSICWLPVALIWFGLNENAIIFVVIMGALLSVTIATTDGVRSIPPIYVRAARTMGASGLALYQHVYLPATLPAIVTGAKLGWSFAWRSLMAGELLFVAGGLGFVLQTGRELNDISLVMAVMLVIIAIGLTADRLFFNPLEVSIRRRWGLGAA